MGKMINEFHTKRMEQMIITAGGDLAFGGKVNVEERYCEPTVIMEPKKDSPVMTEEIFGPILPVYPYYKLREAIDFINKRDKPLAVYYFGDCYKEPAA